MKKRTGKKVQINRINKKTVNPERSSQMDLILKQRSLKCLIRCINFNLGAVRVIRNCLLTMSKFNLPGTTKKF